MSVHAAKYFAFRVVKPGDRQIFIIFAIQIFTVVSQVALPIQLFLVGPIARGLFRAMFRRTNGAEEQAIEEELLKEGIPE